MRNFQNPIFYMSSTYESKGPGPRRTVNKNGVSYRLLHRYIQLSDEELAVQMGLPRDFFKTKRTSHNPLTCGTNMIEEGNNGSLKCCLHNIVHVCTYKCMMGAEGIHSLNEKETQKNFSKFLERKDGLESQCVWQLAKNYLTMKQMLVIMQYSKIPRAVKGIRLNTGVTDHHSSNRYAEVTVDTKRTGKYTMYVNESEKRVHVCHRQTCDKRCRAEKFCKFDIEYTDANIGALKWHKDHIDEIRQAYRNQKLTVDYSHQCSQLKKCNNFWVLEEDSDLYCCRCDIDDKWYLHKCHNLCCELYNSTMCPIKRSALSQYYRDFFKLTLDLSHTCTEEECDAGYVKISYDKPGGDKHPLFMCRRSGHVHLCAPDTCEYQRPNDKSELVCWVSKYVLGQTRLRQIPKSHSNTYKQAHLIESGMEEQGLLDMADEEDAQDALLREAYEEHVEMGTSKRKRQKHVANKKKKESKKPRKKHKNTHTGSSYQVLSPKISLHSAQRHVTHMIEYQKSHNLYLLNNISQIGVGVMTGNNILYNSERAMDAVDLYTGNRTNLELGLINVNVKRKTTRKTNPFPAAVKIVKSKPTYFQVYTCVEDTLSKLFHSEEAKAYHKMVKDKRIAHLANELDDMAGRGDNSRVVMNRMLCEIQEWGEWANITHNSWFVKQHFNYIIYMTGLLWKMVQFINWEMETDYNISAQSFAVGALCVLAQWIRKGKRLIVKHNQMLAALLPDPKAFKEHFNLTNPKPGITFINAMLDKYLKDRTDNYIKVYYNSLFDRDMRGLFN